MGYSFPADGLCHSPSESATMENCTWGSQQLLRTVSAKCIFEDRGLANICDGMVNVSGQHKQTALNRGADILKRALTSAEPTTGGCRDAYNDEAVVESMPSETANRRLLGLV